MKPLLSPTQTILPVSMKEREKLIGQNGEQNLAFAASLTVVIEAHALDSSVGVHSNRSGVDQHASGDIQNVDVALDVAEENGVVILALEEADGYRRIGFDHSEAMSRFRAPKPNGAIETAADDQVIFI